MLYPAVVYCPGTCRSTDESRCVVVSAGVVEFEVASPQWEDLEVVSVRKAKPEAFVAWKQVVVLRIDEARKIVC